MARLINKAHRATMVLYGVIIVLLIIASILLNSHRIISSALFGGVAIALMLPAWILFKISDRISKAQIDMLSRMMNEIQFVPTQKEKYEWLNGDRLFTWTQVLVAEGFESLGDFTIGAGETSVEDVLNRQSFSRIMASSKLHCFADITQSTKAAGTAGEMICTLTSFFTNGQQHGTSNTAPPKIEMKARLPKINMEEWQAKMDAVTQISRRPGVTPSELIRIHIEERDSIAAQRSLVVSEDISFEAYQLQMRQQSKRIREQINQSVDAMLGKWRQ
jgi:hypothetical protein